MIADEGLTLVMHSDARLGFNTLLQRGVYLTGRGGLTVRGFLHEVVGYDDVCIEGEVRTIFLNFSPMDGLDETYIKDGDRLALGSAMPGLVGICMGRDNPYKSFRSDLVSQKDLGEPVGPSVRVFVKVFSVLAVKTGADILARGVELDREVLTAVLEKEAANIVVDAGQDVMDVIAAVREGSGPVRVRVTFV